MHSIYENVKLSTGSLPAVATGTVTGGTMDTQGFHSNAITGFIGNSGDTLSGSVYWTISLEDSPDNSTWTAVAAAKVKAIVDHTAATVTTGAASVVIDAPAEDSRAITFELASHERYVRMLATATGTHTNGTPIGILHVQSNPDSAPVV